MIRPNTSFPPSKTMLPYTSARFRAAQLVHSAGILKAQAKVSLLTVFNAYTVDDFAVGRVERLARFDGHSGGVCVRAAREGARGDRVIDVAEIRAAG